VRFDCPDWSTLIEQGIATDNEHTQKFVYVCHHDYQQEKARVKSAASAADSSHRVPIDFYRWCAAKRIELTGSVDD
jgi:hypothetical protein